MSSEERRSPTEKTCSEGLASTCHLPRLPAPSLLPAWLDVEVCAAWADNALLLDWIHGPFQFIVVLVVIETWPRDTS